MKRMTFLFAAALTALSLCGAEPVISAHVLREADGTTKVPEGEVTLKTTRSKGINGEDVFTCRAISRTDKTKMVQIRKSVSLTGKDLLVFNGKTIAAPKAGSSSNMLIFQEYFPMGAVWDKTTNTGIAIAPGAGDLSSFVELTVAKKDDTVTLTIAVKAAFLRKGATYDCSFDVIRFDAKYGILDAIGRYHMLHPRRFKRDPRTNPDVFGICAQYCSWRWLNPENCRMSGATWEWCHGAGRSWGDPLNRELPAGKDYVTARTLEYRDREGKQYKYRNTDLSLEKFQEIQQFRAANGYYCGVANGFYMMALAYLSPAIARRYPDSVNAAFPMRPKGEYAEATGVHTFPECSWGQEIRRQFAELVKTYDLGSLAFDVSAPSSVYRGPKLREMNNVGFDQHGPGVVRGVGSALLFDYIRTLPCKTLPGNTGVAVNTKYQHCIDMLWCDMMMIECTPWDAEPPFPVPFRYVLGEKGLMMWEGYSPRDFDPNFNKWDEADQHQFKRDLARYAVHRAFASGSSLPAEFLTEYVCRTVHTFIECNDAGWKAVPCATGPAKTEIARYGEGDHAYVSINNSGETARVEVTVFPGELRTNLAGAKKGDPILFAPRFGGKAEQTLADGRETVRVEIPRLLLSVLEAVGSVKGKGTASVNWSGDFAWNTLTIVSKDLEGEFLPRQNFGTYVREGSTPVAIRKGETVKVQYRNAAFRGDLKDVREFPSVKGKQPEFVIRHADDFPSSEIAQRVEFFYREVFNGSVSSKDKKKRKRIRVKLVKDTALPPLTVAVTASGGNTADLGTGITVRPGMMAVRGTDRNDLSKTARRFLDMINAERFPDYGPAVKMEPYEKAYFRFDRL